MCSNLPESMLCWFIKAKFGGFVFLCILLTTLTRVSPLVEPWFHFSQIKDSLISFKLHYSEVSLWSNSLLNRILVLVKYDIDLEFPIIILTDIEIPEKKKLRMMDKVPPPVLHTASNLAVQQRSEAKYCRGPEPIHNKLNYGQYGVQVIQFHIV